MTTTEFFDDDEEMGDVEHALAAVDESQIMNQPRADADEIKDEEAEHKYDVKASAMEIDEIEEEKSKELNDTHRAEKAEKNAAEENLIFAYKIKKGLVAEKRMVREQKEEKALTARFRDGKHNRARIQALQHEVKEIQLQLLKTNYYHKKIAKAEAAQKTLTKRKEQKLTEVEELKKDHAKLDRAKAELNANQRRASQENDNEAFVLEGSRLEEYHLIKEAAQLKTNLLQKAADQNEVDILTQNHAENQKMISMLTDDLKQTYEQIGTMERAICRH
ncbi:hypothetical protein PsorP6_009677 [Peronosclerospora sorghi]|uniref:Uncharacterized protein n=1 Tax=Peronosclerospora sorghi TaxID=230839 RepID=A0ACC0VZ64_9STRA|nr:hypothetical protein PsorP6_009677 [Peronosclerospora sorghi]